MLTRSAIGILDGRTEDSKEEDPEDMGEGD